MVARISAWSSGAIGPIQRCWPRRNGRPIHADELASGMSRLLPVVKDTLPEGVVIVIGVRSSRDNSSISSPGRALRADRSLMRCSTSAAICSVSRRRLVSIRFRSLSVSASIRAIRSTVTAVCAGTVAGESVRTPAIGCIAISLTSCGKGTPVSAAIRCGRMMSSPPRRCGSIGGVERAVTTQSTTRSSRSRSPSGSARVETTCMRESHASRSKSVTSPGVDSMAETGLSSSGYVPFTILTGTEPST